VGQLNCYEIIHIISVQHKPTVCCRAEENVKKFILFLNKAFTVLYDITI
jgi:hypothetical protein